MDKLDYVKRVDSLRNARGHSRRDMCRALSTILGEDQQKIYMRVSNWYKRQVQKPDALTLEAIAELYSESAHWVKYGGPRPAQ